MMKLLVNQAYEQMGLRVTQPSARCSTRTPATLPRAFSRRAQESVRAAVTERDALRRLRAASALSTLIGVVLAGGRGSRLGGEGKATVELAGRPLLGYVLEAMTGALDDVAVAAGRDRAARLQGRRPPARARQPPVALWTEPDEPRHPLAGLRHALRRAGGRPVLACAVDMPLITAPLVAEIAEADAHGALAVVPLTGTCLQPCWPATTRERWRCSRPRAATRP
jgi:molybdopterin-guanine dinucleotide biosynthesis protein A